MLSGGFGGSRQGVIEANANNDLQNNIGSALANLYGNGYNTATSYDLGLRNNQLGYDNLDRNINNDNLGWQLQGANFGLGLYNQLLNNDTNQYNTGTTVQNAPMNYWQNFTNQANALGNGYSTTTGTQNYGSNPLLSAYGGSQMFGGMFGNGNSANANRGTYGTNWGTGKTMTMGRSCDPRFTTSPKGNAAGGMALGHHLDLGHRGSRLRRRILTGAALPDHRAKTFKASQIRLVLHSRQLHR